MNSAKVQWIVVAACFVVYGAITGFYKVDTTQQGVVTRFGAFSHIADEGPHFKIPFGVDHVYKIEVTRIHELQFGFRKDSDGGITPNRGRLESLMLTGDLNVAVVEWILQYRIADPRKFLFNAANVEKNIRDISISVMRRVVGDTLVDNVLTTDRVLIAQRARDLTQEVLDAFDMGIQITKLSLQNVTPPEEVKPAFNEINIAKQEKEQLINQAKGVYNRVIPEADGKGKRLIAEAEAYAVDLVNRARGDSEKLVQVMAAYKSSPEVTRKRMYLETMEEILTQSDRFIVVDSAAKGILPVYGKMSDLEKGVVGAEHEKTATGDASTTKLNEKKW